MGVTEQNLERQLGPFEKRFIMALMPLLFRSVYGWRDRAHYPGAQRFDVPGVDGSILRAAMFRTGAAAPKGVVLLCHPFLKYGMAWFFKNGYPDWMTRAGYHVVAFNFKGFGESSLGGIAFSDDVFSVAQAMRARHPGLPMHLLGASFGAYHSIHSIARNEFGFASIVFDSVPAQIATFFGSGALGSVMRRIARSRWAHSTGTKSIIDSLPAIGRTPCMFMFGSHDDYINDDEVRQIGTHCRAVVNVYPGCGHLEIRKAHPERYVTDITQFFDLHSQRGAASQ
jgi:pimeloyl-ACP methyl ester carboxylesterase